MLKDHEMSETRTEKLLVQLQVTAAVMNGCDERLFLLAARSQVTSSLDLKTVQETLRNAVRF